mgnify:CR=1 FL=1
MEKSLSSGVRDSSTAVGMTGVGQSSEKEKIYLVVLVDLMVLEITAGVVDALIFIVLDTPIIMLKLLLGVLVTIIIVLETGTTSVATAITGKTF